MTEIIAEIGWNFLGDMDLARKMIDAAKRAGADSVKFQYWNPKYLKPGAWDTDGRRDIYEKAKLDEDRINLLKEYVNSLGISCFFSVFSVKDAEFIHELGEMRIKIPSHEVHNLGLLEFSLTNFQEVILSTGAAQEGEVERALSVSKTYENVKLNIMHCVSSYPCMVENLNLPRLSWLQQFGVETGLSDHTGSLVSGATAVALGVEKIEKHFTIDNNLPGRDNQFALDEGRFLTFSQNIREAEKMMTSLGNYHQDSEIDIINEYRGRWSLNCEY